MGTEQGSDAVKELIARGEDADGRTSPGENFRHRIGKWRRPLRRHLSVRRAEMQCERIRKLISRWHRDEPGARAQGSAAEMLESVSTDSRHYPLERGARFAEGDGHFTGMPRMTLRLRYRTWKLRALCWVLRRLRRHQLTQY
jgi:hypothetical protein